MLPRRNVGGKPGINIATTRSPPLGETAEEPLMLLLLSLPANSDPKRTLSESRLATRETVGLKF